EAASHIIFALDRSYSMSHNDRKPLENIRLGIREKIAQRHDNRLGAVYSFMETRLTSQRNLTKGAINKDTVSLILFNSSTIVPIENQPLSDLDKFLDIMIEHSPCDGTNFELAIQKAGFLIDKYYDPTKTNIIIFLSDGEGGSPDAQLENICRVNQQRGSLLYLYTILFGSDSNSQFVRFFDSDPSLVKMANIAQKYLPANSSPQSLKCQYTKTIDEIALANHFTIVAESLRRHKPSLMKKYF
ncbi:1548_t:CDS:2, partial [Entrophospora sp. SA101]